MLNNEFSIKAGEMKIEDNKAKANPDKGEIKFFFKEGLLFFQWKNITKNIEKEPLVITPGEWIWKKIGTSKGRVYMLQGTTYEEEKYIFYMQYPISSDVRNFNIINNILKTGNLIIDDKENSNEENKINNNNLNNNNTQIQNNNVLNNNVSNNNQKDINQSNLDFIKSFTAALQQIQKKYPTLNKILTRVNIVNLLSKLNEKEKEELIKLLPENQQNIQGLHDNISSPQFQQGLDALTSALNSENLQAIIQSFQLDINEAQKYANGVEAFIKCIVKQFSPKKNENEEKKDENIEKQKEEEKK